MPELSDVVLKIEEESSRLREKTGSKGWGRLSRRAFVQTIEGTLPGLEEIYSLFQIARNEAAKRPEDDPPELGEHLAEVNKLVTILKRNKELEEAGLHKTLAGAGAVAETFTTPELYSSLEHKVLAALLRSTYLAERLRIFDRKREPAQPKAVHRNILELLAQREEEVAELRRKYEESKRNALFGSYDKESSADTERDLNDVSRGLEAKVALMRRAFDAAKMFAEQGSRQQLELEQRILAVEELEARLAAKAFELITLLKKERDFAKKMLIEMEQETVKLRNTYSKELLGMHEEKLGIRKAAEERFEKEIAALKKDLASKEETIEQFRRVASDGEKRIQRLEEENERLMLVADTVGRHRKIREALLGKKAEAKEFEVEVLDRRGKQKKKVRS